MHALTRLVHSLPLLVLFASALTAPACSKKNEVSLAGAEIGSSCSAPDACGGGASCVFGKCRLECNADIECMGGALCLGTGPFGCSLAFELACSSGQPCDNGLTCGSDGKCRMPCATDPDCKLNGHACSSEGCK